MLVLFVTSLPEEASDSSPASLSCEEDKELRAAGERSEPCGKGQPADLYTTNKSFMSNEHDEVC